jgi:hypothetical protein
VGTGVGDVADDGVVDRVSNFRMSQVLKRCSCTGGVDLEITVNPGDVPLSVPSKMTGELASLQSESVLERRDVAYCDNSAHSFITYLRPCSPSTSTRYIGVENPNAALRCAATTPSFGNSGEYRKRKLPISIWDGRFIRPRFR